MARCESCKYADKKILTTGCYCRRYPKYIERELYQWCGEYKPKATQPQVSPDHAKKVLQLIKDFGMASSEWGKHWVDSPRVKTFDEAHKDVREKRDALYLALGIDDE